MATLDEVAEQFALDDMFSYYPDGATLDDLEVVANSVGVFTDVEDWMLCGEYEELAYISAYVIVQKAVDIADQFRRYYERVDVN